MRIRTRNRRRDPRRRSMSRRRLVLGLSLALCTGVLLGLESPLPDTSSMGLRLDLRALHRFELPLLKIAPIDWREALRLPFLRLDRVYFFGLRKLDAQSLTDSLGLSERIALVDVNPGAVCAGLRSQGRIEDCTAVRLPPGILAVAVRERDPVAVLEDTTTGVSADGQHVPLLRDEAEALPRVTGEIDRALAYVEAAELAGVPLRRVDARPKGSDRVEVVLYPRHRVLRILPGPHPVASLMRYRVLVGAGAIDRDGLELDLRFRGRVFLREMPAGKPDEGGEA